jgi:hypothetical protein
LVAGGRAIESAAVRAHLIEQFLNTI